LNGWRKLPAPESWRRRFGSCAKRPTRQLQQNRPHPLCLDFLMTSPLPDIELSEELIRRFDTLGPRYTAYPTADRFHVGFL